MTDPAPIIIDGSRQGKIEQARREVPGLDFPLADGSTVRLPYPALRYFPTGDHPTDPTKVTVGERLGYPAPVQKTVDTFLEVLDTGTTHEILAAAVVVAWLMITRGALAGPDFNPAVALEMDSADASVFVHRMYRLVAGLVDLDRDQTGAFLLPVARLSEEQTDPDPDSQSGPSLEPAS